MSSQNEAFGCPHLVVDGIESALAEVTETDPEEAQRWANFAVLVPTTGALAVTSLTLRRECPPGRRAGMDGRSPWTDANPSAVRIELEGPGVALRLKEFLYDWAPAAAGQPCLWSRPTRPLSLPGGGIVWVGTDYMDRQGAYARVGRTSVELSVLTGHLSDEQLVDLYASLRPASAEAAEALAACPLATLSYWVRHRMPLQEVPWGLWWFHREPGDPSTWTSDGAVTSDAGVDVRLVDGPPGLSFDSLGLFGRDHPANEIEVVYTARPRREDEVRLVVEEPGHGRLQVPPRLDKHPCKTDSWWVCDRHVRVAFVDDTVGPYEAVWEEPSGRHIMLLGGVGRDRTAFEALVDWTMEVVA